jgi:hypothetical protein
LLDMSEKFARQSIKNHNADADKLMGADTSGAYKAVAPLMRVDEPGEYAMPKAQAPTAPAGGVIRWERGPDGKPRRAQ